MKKFPKLFLIACSALILAAIFCLTARGQNTARRTITVGELTRTYYLHVPPDLPEGEVALVLVFHGGGGTPAFAKRETRFSDLADQEGFLVAYPEGIGKSWNDGRGDDSIAAQRENIDDLAFVSALIDEVAKDYPVDEKRVYATGISNGATFSHCLAANLSSRIATIAPVAGGLPEPLSNSFMPEEPVAVLILQGTDDPLVPYNGGDVTPPGMEARGRIISTDEAVQKWVAHNGSQTEPVVEDLPDTDANDGCLVSRFTYANATNGAEVVLYGFQAAATPGPTACSICLKR